MRRTLVIPAAAAAVLTLSPASVACPLCESETADEVRAGLFNEDFAGNLAATLLPFPVFGAIVFAAHVGWPRRLARRDGPASHAGRP